MPPTRRTRKTTAAVGRARTTRCAKPGTTSTRVRDALRGALHAAPVLPSATDTAPVTVDDSTTSDVCTIIEHLATTLHAMCLVTMVEKAQAKAVPYRRTATTTAPPLVCATVDERWLAAVTRCCGTRTTLDDLARVAAAFPQWLRVRWGLVEAAPCVATDAQNDGSSITRSAPSSAGDLTARVCLLRDAVPSVADAAAALHAAWRAMADDDAARRRWLAAQTRGVGEDSAYKAWRAQAATPPVVSQPPCVGDDAVVGGLVPRKRNVAKCGKRAASRAEARLLVSVSPELRAALSEGKLRGVLRQMQRDETCVEAKEQERIAQARDREQLLRTYEHVLSVFGRRHTVLNAAYLLRALGEHAERVEDSRATCRRLQLLLDAHATTGLSAVTGGEEGESVCTVQDLLSLSDAQLQWTVVRLRRDAASVVRFAATLDGPLASPA